MDAHQEGKVGQALFNIMEYIEVLTLPLLPEQEMNFFLPRRGWR
jgi:hypothetical protein